MPFKYITADIDKVIATKSRPAVTWWNRLEGRPRADKFERALRAEVRDALWMLTRQWQIGEFRGDDAGSPIFTKVRVETTPLTKYQPADGSAEPFTDDIPLEARVEQMPIPFLLAGHEVSLDIRVLLGRQWLKLVRAIPGIPATVAGEFATQYSIHAPDPANTADAATAAHPEALATFRAVARLVDGAKLYAHLKTGGNVADGIPSLGGFEAQAAERASRFVGWAEKLFYQPAQSSAWVPDRLEYQFAVATPAGDHEKVYAAGEYYHGHLDWYNFDVDPARTALGEIDPAAPAPKGTRVTMLPTQVTFNGMPNTRWWAFEDGRTNFGDVKPDTTDLAKLLLIEFGLVYANDWFIVPYTVPAGSIATVRGVAVTNVFGERIWVDAAGRGLDDDWQRWAMFLNSVAGQGRQMADLSLMIPPAAQKVLEGPPLEEIMFARDEMANMVWGIERTITLPTGDPKPGREAAYEMRRFFERDLERRLGAPPQPPPMADGARIRYQVMTSVPEHWIPMVPVHVENDNRETQLQRAAMLRILVGAPPAETPPPVEPRTSLFRAGLDQTPKAPYFVHEEEVPRAGVRVTQGFQRTRWRDGRAWVWLGVRKQTGRGEGSSGLAFDRLVDIPPPA
jgi:hypothetical protein